MIVYTCLVGKNDVLKPVKSKLQHICFTDDTELRVDGWEMRPLYENFLDPVKTARFHKTVGMNLLGTDALWQDAKVAFKQDPAMLISEADIMLFNHPRRNCIYQEGKRVIELGKAEPGDIKKQLTAYHEFGFPEAGGLYETCVVFRKANSMVRQLNELWWQHIQDYSRRDQISLPFILRSLKIVPNIYSYDVYANSFFDISHHPIVKRMVKNL